MNIASRYSDDDRVVIDPNRVPASFRHLIPLAKEWSIGDDIELEEYIDSCSDQQLRDLDAAFSPHFDGLWEWHSHCKNLIPQPDELVMFDIATNAAASVQAMLE